MVLVQLRFISPQDVSINSDYCTPSKEKNSFFYICIHHLLITENSFLSFLDQKKQAFLLLESFSLSIKYYDVTLSRNERTKIREYGREKDVIKDGR